MTKEPMSLVERTIAEHIGDQQTIFVFPTQTAADLWADQATQSSGVSAVAMERFIAWDDFKGSAVKSQQQDKSAIPATMRSFFAAHLIAQNAARPFLHTIIVDEYAHSADAFTDFIASMLPSLRQWHDIVTKRNIPLDDEDRDLLELYRRYAAFLEEQQLFDPAWETPPFADTGLRYVIFFPEILMDYIEYERLLASSDTITLVHLPPEEKTRAEAHVFSNARGELQAVALHLRQLHEERGIPWTDIAISVPDMDTYLPYLERELSLHAIPAVARNGTALAATGAGNFFAQAQECVRQRFSFDSVKDLLLNTELPWKEKELNMRLINFGKANSCLCSYTRHGTEVDVWEEAFKGDGRSERERNLYHALKAQLTPFVHARSFAEMRRRYFSFRNTFFNMEACPEQSDRIISRCITELSGLIDLEAAYPSCTVPHPFRFFVSYLAQKMYVPQRNQQGVQILPYRLAAMAPFAVHVVIDASQSSLSVIYRQLGFLNDDKRKRLGLAEDSNISDAFIHLYRLSARQESYFTCAQQTFTGYALCHGSLDERQEHRPEPHEHNYYRQEQDFFQKEERFPTRLFPLMKQGFSVWSAQSAAWREKTVEQWEALRPHIKNRLYDKDTGKCVITATALKHFYVCPRLWLFTYIVPVEPLHNEASLMENVTMGELNHRILEKYCMTLMRQNKPFFAKEDGLENEYRAWLMDSTESVLREFKTSTLAKDLLQTERDAIYKNIEQSVIECSHWFEGYSVLATEQEYAYNPPDKAYMLKGRIDCLLADPSGETCLIDFKNTRHAVPQQTCFCTEENDIPDAQMPMYLHLLENQPKPIHVDTAAFYAIADRRPYCVIGTVKNPFKPRARADIQADRPDFAQSCERFLKMLDEYAEKLDRLDFLPLPTADSQAFARCHDARCAHYRAICRRFFTVSREEELKRKDCKHGER